MNTAISTEQQAFSLTKSWFVWMCAALFYGYQFLLRVSPNVMTSELMEAFSIDGCTLGTLTGLYYYGYSSLQVPGGTLVDRFGAKKMLTFAALFCASGVLLFSFADTIYIAGIGRFMIGAGSAFGFLSCLKTGTSMFPPKKLPLIIGMTLFLGVVGAMSAGKPLVYLIDAFGWRTALWVLATMGVAISLIALLFVDTNPEPELKKYILSHHEEITQELGILEGVSLIIKKPQTWLVALYGMLLYVPLAGFADLWAVPFFETNYNISKEDASYAVSAMYLGLGLGAPCVSFMVNYFKSYKKNLYIAAVLPLILLSLVVYLPSTLMSFYLLLSLLFASGFFLGSQFLIFTVICEMNPLSVSSTAGGFLNMMCMISGVIFQPFIGKLLDMGSHHLFLDGVSHYSSEDFLFAMSTIPLALLIGALTVPFIREVYRQD